MIIAQTVDIPASHRLTIDVPHEVPEGPVVLTFMPAAVREKAAVPLEARGQSNSDDFHRAYGAWAANPWENCMEELIDFEGYLKHKPSSATVNHEGFAKNLAEVRRLCKNSPVTVDGFIEMRRKERDMEEAQYRHEEV
jgi:hypothetical protein